MTESNSEEQQPTLRQRTRDAVREQVGREALALFVRNGFEATTADQIAEAVGISVRSFYRYFPAKEDVLVADSIAFGAHVARAFERRPTEEPVWLSLRQCLTPLVSAIQADPQRGLDMMHVIMSTAALRAAHFEKHLAWEQRLVPMVRARLENQHGPEHPLRAQTLTHAALACLDVALEAWVASHGESSLGDLLDEVFAQLD